MNDSPLKPASSRRKKMDKTMMAIYFLILFYCGRGGSAGISMPL